MYIIKNFNGQVIFQGASLIGANLNGACLIGANLDGANLNGANLNGANLKGASLERASLNGASLNCACLIGACLIGACLIGANLDGASLDGADLKHANLEGAKLPNFLIVPEEGSFIGWKKVCSETVLVILKLKIPSDAQRTSSLVGRKCRASKVEVLDAYTVYGDKIPDLENQVFKSVHYNKSIYKVGEIVEPDCYDGDIRIECTNGIHFFITRKEAEDY